MSVAITIRDVPEETRNALASKAALRGQSMQQFVRQLLVDTAARRTQDELIAEIVARNRAAGNNVSRDWSVKAVREDRAR
jgi:plasmid stability protein